MKLKIVSLGNNCCVSIGMKNLQIKQESYPFDWCINNPLIILDCLKTDFKNFVKFGDYTNLNDFGMKNLQQNTIKRRTYYGSRLPDFYHNYYNMEFGHFKNLNQEQLVSTFKRRCDRFLNLINEGNKKILFVYTEEVNFFNKHFIDMKEKFYNALLEIEKIFFKKNLDFKILTITINQPMKETKNIINCNIEYDKKLFIDIPSWPIHIKHKNNIPFGNYRGTVQDIIKNYIKKQCLSE